MTPGWTAMPGFGDRFMRAVRDRGPLCVGIDPSAQLLAAWGLSDDPVGLEEMGRAVLDAAGDVAAVVKPQSAFYERMGSRGLAVLERLCVEAHQRGLLVLLDAKRGDIGTTCAAYGQAYLASNAPLELDAITASPYLGVGALRPLFDEAFGSGRGVFVVARSSNPEGDTIQHARTAGGRDVVGHVLDEVAEVNAGRAGSELGSIGVVFGATCPTDGYDLEAFGGPILAPGLGAQGADVDDLARRFASCGARVLPTVSRGVLQFGPSVAAMREKVVGLVEDCRKALGHG